MSGHRFAIEAFAGPARRGRVSGGALLLVRVRLFDGAGVVSTLTGEPAGEPDTFCDLDPREARDLALGLLAAADDAEQQTRNANHWEPKR